LDGGGILLKGGVVMDSPYPNGGRGVNMDALLQSAKDNVKLMIDAWNGDATMLDALLDEIRAELERGLGATVEPKELTPEEKREAKEFLDDLFLGGKA
jgi:hypothetical protein